MKRIISLLAALLLLFSCTALAETAESDTVTLTLTDVGITVDIPSQWYYATADMGEEAPLAKLFNIPADILKAFLTENGYIVYATTDEQELTRFSLSVMPGTPLIDMRDKNVDMDALMEGFLQTFTAGTVVDSRAYITDEAAFARIHCIVPFDGGEAHLLVYGCNTAGQIYTINFIALPGMELPEEQMDAIIDSIHFID